jgi:hypothetical protein
MSNPKSITIKSDGNVLEFVQVVKTGVNGMKLPEPLYLYKYSKSITKKGQELLLTAKQIEALEKINNG